MKTAKRRRKVKVVALKEETYRRLERYKLRLIHERKNPKITYDQVIRTLLDMHEKKGGGGT